MRSYQPLMFSGLLLLGVILPVLGAERVALVIGNSTYAHGRLINPSSDAQDMAQALRELGFAVTLKENLDRAGMASALSAFGNQLSQRGGVGLFYYAGHGAEVKGVNYLIPVQAQIENEADVEFEAIDVRRVLRQMEEARAQVSLVIIDACRNNPFARSFVRSSETRGLVRTDAPDGSLIASSTASGDVAADGAYGRNSPYTKYLKEVIRKPNLSVEQVFKEVRRQVLKETGGKQRPWETSSLTEEFYFTTSQPSTPPPAVTQPSTPPPVEKTMLAVKPTPADAQVRIMNIVPAYRDGIELPPGRYDIEVSRSAYRTHRQWYELAAGEQVVEVVLEKLASTDGQAEPESRSPGLSLGTDVFFDSKSSELNEGQLAKLNILLSDLTLVRVSAIDIVGHTDSTGTEEDNQWLSEQRAASVRDHLVKNGVDQSLITTRGMGELQPVGWNTNADGTDNPEGRAMNNRVDITVVAFEN